MKTHLDDIVLSGDILGTFAVETVGGDKVLSVGSNAIITANVVTGVTSLASFSTPQANPDVIEMQGTTGYILCNVLTTTQRDLLTPVKGMLIYNDTTNKFQGYNGAWVDFH